MDTKAVTWSRRGFWAICVAYAAYAVYLSRAQFLTWHADAAQGAFLVPPFRPIGYFLRYAFAHFWLPYAISFLVAGAFFLAAKRLNARRGGMLFEPEELYFMAIGFFISGHPGWIFYAVIVLAAYLLAALIGAAFHGARARVSFYYFWLPCAALTVALGAYLPKYAWYASLLV